MKKIIFFLLFTITVAISGEGQDFYDIETINTLEIIFAEDNWDFILDSLYANGEEERLAGTAFINGDRYDSVGVRYKGTSTYSPARIKNPLNIKLDYIFDNQSIDGYGTLKLANAWHDPSFLREVLSYEIARKYMPASKANFIEVTVNGEYLGLYVSVQDIDKLFARSFNFDDDGAYFKGEFTGGYILETTTIWGYMGPDSAAYYDYYEIKSDDGWGELIDFLEVLNNEPANREEVLNIDRHLWMLAFDNLLVNLDAPVNVNHNFYLFQDFSERFNPVIWDLNESFGSFRILLSSGQTLSFAQMIKLNPFVNLNHADYPIIGKVLSDSTCRKKYIAHMKTILEENFANRWYENRGLQIQGVIEPEVKEDPHKFYSYRNFLDNLYTGIVTSSEMIIGLIQLMDSRMEYLSTLPEFQTSAPIISNISYSPDTVISGTTVSVSVTVTGADEVTLGYREDIGRCFEKTVMFDDGAHNDGAADDQVFGVSLTAGSGDIQYYIYAENDEAGCFSPPRAEFEYFTINVTAPITAPLKINEFMASNETTVTDADDEYEDWIELYNTADRVVSLGGFYLSDKTDDLTQWPFPDTVIAPYGFLLIWADDDPQQAGLHATFKLSASGEAVVLVDCNGVVVDEITFGPQLTDISYGRLPDGGVPWLSFTNPTPGNANVTDDCCTGTVGNVDCSEAEEPDIADVLALIDYLYLVHTPLCCPDEVDADASGGDPDMSDITRLVDYIFLSHRPLPPCP